MSELLCALDSAVFQCVDARPPVLGHACDLWVKGGWHVRWLRGGRMVDKPGLLGEFAAALQFPWYFGSNWDAFDECLSQMPLVGRRGVILVVFDAGSVLCRDHDALRVFVDSVSMAQEVYATAVECGQWWDRPAIPFHVVLQISESESVRWEEAGASLAWMRDLAAPPEVS